MGRKERQGQWSMGEEAGWRGKQYSVGRSCVEDVSKQVTRISRETHVFTLSLQHTCLVQ